MARHRRRKDSDLWDIVAPLGGLIAMAVIFVPPFRQVLVALFVLILVLAALTLVGALAIWIYRSWRRGGDTPVRNFGWEHTSPKKQGLVLRPSSDLHLELTAPEPPPRVPDHFTEDLLNALEWRRLEQLVEAYFKKTGYEARRSRVGADGGVDVLVFRSGEEKPCAYAQCKAWHVYKVGVKPIRELLGVIKADGVDQGYFVTTGVFTQEALDFAEKQSIRLVSGEYLLEKLNSLPDRQRQDLLQEITSGDYTTPTCPRCDVKMVLRHGKNGDFWGCPSFSRRPSCGQKFNIRADQSP